MLKTYNDPIVGNGTSLYFDFADSLKTSITNLNILPTNNTFTGLNTFNKPVTINDTLLVKGFDIYDIIIHLPQVVRDNLYNPNAVYPFVADVIEKTITFYSYVAGSDYLTVLLKLQSDLTIGPGRAIEIDLSQDTKNKISVSYTHLTLPTNREV